MKNQSVKVAVGILTGMLTVPTSVTAGFYVIPVGNNSKGDAEAADVLEGKTFSNADEVEIEGTMLYQEPVTITPGKDPYFIPAGYHSGAGKVAGDSRLVSGNIKKGVNIFGVTGDLNVIDSTVSSSAGAQAEHLIKDKEAWVNGKKITGTMPIHSPPITITPGTAAQAIPEGYHDGNGTVAGDGQLIPSNIKKNVTVFGVTGTFTDSGDAVASDLKAGKKVWVDGEEITGTMPTRVLSPDSMAVESGYYESTTLNGVDTDLAAGNIKSGVNMFGVAGTMTSIQRTGENRCVFDPDPSIAGGWAWDEDCSLSHPPGLDGELQKGTEWPVPRFINNGDGTVTDKLTGLIWLKDANCAGMKTWPEALNFVAELSAGGGCGLTDTSGTGEWRLPNINELHSIISYKYLDPALSNSAGTAQWKDDPSDPDPAFTHVQSNYYWSSTTFATNPDKVWYLDLKNGMSGIGDNTISYYVWPVRDPQN